VTRLMVKYNEEIVPELKKKLHRDNIMSIPKLEKIVVNMGVGKAIENKRRLENAVKDLSLIAGQRPVITKAKKSIAGFKLRAGQEIGCKVTLRNKRMYEFLDRLISIAIPRIRDFRGVSRKSFDPCGNYSLGIKDQSVFPEINLDTVEFVQGMDICMVIKNSKSSAESLELLSLFGMPFRKGKTEEAK